jgi:hypothetical protein
MPAFTLYFYREQISVVLKVTRTKLKECLAPCLYIYVLSKTKFKVKIKLSHWLIKHKSVKAYVGMEALLEVTLGR